MNSGQFISARRRASTRCGQALVEFAIIAFVFTFLLGAMLALGFLFFSANVVQQAADVGAMELARHPDSPTETFQNALQDSGLYDPAFLVCLIGGPNTSNEDLPNGYTQEDVEKLQDRMPLINRLLFSVYIFDPDWNALRYPGARAEFGGEETVIIPIVGSRDPTTGVETIVEWRRVVEEIVPNGATEGPYSLTSTTTGNLDPGMVALRINYPHQSSSMVAYVHVDGGQVLSPSESLGQDFTNVPVQANDNAVVDNGTLPTGYRLVAVSKNLNYGASAHRGTYGLGEAQAFLTTVRPYRKVVTAQGIYRREVFE